MPCCGSINCEQLLSGCCHSTGAHTPFSAPHNVPLKRDPKAHCVLKTVTPYLQSQSAITTLHTDYPRAWSEQDGSWAIGRIPKTIPNIKCGYGGHFLFIRYTPDAVCLIKCPKTHMQIISGLKKM